MQKPQRTRIRSKPPALRLACSCGTLFIRRVRDGGRSSFEGGAHVPGAGCTIRGGVLCIPSSVVSVWGAGRPKIAKLRLLPAWL